MSRIMHVRRRRVFRALLGAWLVLILLAAGLLLGQPAIRDHVEARATQALWAVSDHPEPADDLLVLEFDSFSRIQGLDWYRNPLYWTFIVETAVASDARALVINNSFANLTDFSTMGVSDPSAATLSEPEQALLSAIEKSDIPVILVAQQQPDGSYLPPFRGIADATDADPVSSIDGVHLAVDDRGHDDAGRMNIYDFGGASTTIAGEPTRLDSIPVVLARALDLPEAKLDRVPDRAALGWYGSAGSFEIESSASAATGVAMPNLRDKIVFVNASNDGKQETTATVTTDALPLVEVDATAVSNLVAGHWRHLAPQWTGVAIGLALALLAFVCIVMLRPALGTPLVAGGIAAWLVAAQQLWEAGTLVPLGTSLVIGLAGLLAAAGGVVLTSVRERLRIKGMFARYVSPEVVNELAGSDDPIKLGGEAREITVLFADIRGFTSLSEHAEPEEMVRDLNEFFAEMVEVITRHGGTLDKFLGDGLMAIFGAPTDQEDHAERAVRTAMAMLGRIDRLNDARLAANKPELRIGIGIHTGEAVVGNIGSPLFRVDFTAIGDTVNLASRLEGATKEIGCPVLVSGDTVAAVGPGIGFEPHGSVVVKGRTAATEVFQPTVGAPG